jgi:hypothetical protein
VLDIADDMLGLLAFDPVADQGSSEQWILAMVL